MGLCTGSCARKRDSHNLCITLPKGHSGSRQTQFSVGGLLSQETRRDPRGELLLIRGFAVLRDGADIRLHICYLERHAINPLFGIAGIAARFRWIHARLDDPRPQSAFYLDFMMQLSIELVTHTLQNIDQASLILDYDVVPALTVKAAANRADIGGRHGRGGGGGGL